MSLQIWLPFNGNLKNYGLKEVKIINNGTTFDANGKIGQCCNIASGQYLGFDATNQNNHKYPYISIACWIYPTQSDSTERHVICCYESGGCGINLKNTKFGGQVYIGGYKSCYTPNTISLNTWYHVCMTYDGTKLCLYLNGEQVATVAASGPITYHNTCPWQIAGNPGATSFGSNNFIGKINDFRMYDHALSAKEVKEIAKGLVLHYKLDGNGKGNDNILLNTHFDNRYAQTSGWDTTKNGTLLANSWGGYNSGVSNQATVYHAHLKEFEGQYVYEYIKTANETWLGISQGGLQTKLIAGQTYTFSWEEYHVDGTNRVGTGLYYYKTGATSANFHLGIQQASNITRVIGQWQKYSYTFVAPNDADYSKNISWYIYGHYNNNGTFYMRYPKLELNDSATIWTPNPNDSIYSLYNDKIIYDSSGFNNNGTIIGSLNTIALTPRYDYAIQFDNNTDSITVSPYLSNRQTLNEITVSCWFKTNTLNSTSPNIFSLGENAFLRCRLASATSIWSYYRVISTQKSTTYSCKNLIDNNWHLLTFVFQNGIEKVYIDGLQIGSTDQSSTGTYLTCANTAWHLAGYAANSENFIGSLSDFRIYTTALTAEQVKELYNTSVTIDNKGNVYARELVEI